MSVTIAIWTKGKICIGHDARAKAHIEGQDAVRACTAYFCQSGIGFRAKKLQIA